MTDDDKRNLKVQQKEENLKYYEEMQQWLNGLTVEDREAYEVPLKTIRPGLPQFWISVLIWINFCHYFLLNLSNQSQLPVDTIF